MPVLVFLGCSRLRPDVRDRQTSDVRQTDVRQTDVRRASSLKSPYRRGGGIIIIIIIIIIA